MQIYPTLCIGISFQMASQQGKLTFFEEEKVQEIKKAFFEYAAHKTLSACDTPGYFARQILPEESFFLKANVIIDLIEAGIMVIRGEKWIIKK
jgi:hypothetical protein